MKGIDLPKEEHLRACEIRNKDGIGVALLRENTAEIMIKKDFIDIETFIKWFYDNVKKEDTCIIHYRLATHGLVDTGNRHPFPITKNKELLRKAELICQMVVAHNGIISDYGVHPKFSDTQKFVLDILADETIKNNLHNEAVRKLIKNFIGSDKLVVLSSDGVMYFWGEWEKVGEIYYSNRSYLDIKSNFSFMRDSFDNFGYGDYNKSINSGLKDICDGCGKEKHVQVVDYNENYDGDYWYLCKACRKQMRKGKLKLPVKEILYGDNALTKVEKLSLSETQCENCLEWVEYREINDYFGHKVCVKCLTELIQLGLEKREKI
jgi:predicted glutamine amidotransferase